MLNGHVDVVPPAAESLWTSAAVHAPRARVTGSYGRGSGDMKAGLAAIVGAVAGPAPRSASQPLAAVQLQSVVEEECGGNGALQCRPSAGFRPDGVRHPGALPRRGHDLAGRGALVPRRHRRHPGPRRRRAGWASNAIEAAFPIVAELRRARGGAERAARRSRTTSFDHPVNLNVGVHRGRRLALDGAAECSLSCRLALYPGQEVEWLKARVEAAVAACRGTPPVSSPRIPPRVRYDGFAGQGVEVAADRALVDAVSRGARAGRRRAGRARRDHRDDRRPASSSLSGIPAVCFGPWAERIHGVDERVHLPSVPDDGSGARAARPRLVRSDRVSAGAAPLRGISEIRRFFRTNETPIWFVSATSFNLLGIDRWVRSFSFLNYYDSFDGAHPHVFVPPREEPPAFESIEEICNYLLAHKEVVDHVAARGPGKARLPDVRRGDRAARRARPGSKSRSRRPPCATRLDSKIVTTAARRRGRRAERPQRRSAAPRPTRELLGLADAPGIGTDLVVQTPYGDSGQTTFFVASERRLGRARREDRRPRS